MKIGVFLPNWLGDLVMATPALRAIRRHFGSQALVTGIVRPHLVNILGGSDWFDDLCLFDPRSSRPEFRRLALLRRLRQERFDQVVLFTNSLHTAILAWLGGARERVGYVRYARGPLLTTRLMPPHKNGRLTGVPMVEYYLRLAEAIGCPAESPQLELSTTEADERLADQIWDTLGLRSERGVVLLNSSGAYGPAKIWPAAHFGKLARRVAGELGHDVVMLCGPSERDMAREVVRHAAHPRVFSMADQPLDFGVTKAFIRRGRMMVSTDSGPRHIGAAFGLPLITLYGPMLPIWAENPTVRSVDLWLDLPCIGCHKRVCPLHHHRCLEDLPVDMVYAEVVKILREERVRTAM